MNVEQPTSAEVRPPIPRQEGKLGTSDKTAEGHDVGKSYLNKYLRGIDYPDVDQLQPTHVEGDHLYNLLEGAALWLSRTSFPTSQGSWLSNKAKLQYISRIKTVLMDRFSKHELWKESEWWTEMRADFREDCKRFRIEDVDVAEVQKSVPLYRDLSNAQSTGEDANPRAVRAKYYGETIVDSKSIAMSMIKGGTEKDAEELAEFCISRAAIGRGGEHAFVRWNEGTFDPYFEAPDFDWSIIKQKDRQCMLLFCDRHLYCLCPFFALGVYFMLGGLRREHVEDEIKDFMFPHLHAMKKESVARKLTRSIQKNINAEEEVKKSYTSRSMRKGTMTENRMHPDLSSQEEYARSGHTPPEHNLNAEGYIEFTPAMNAPAGLAVAGYSDCHKKVVPYSFHALSHRVKDEVD